MRALPLFEVMEVDPIELNHRLRRGGVATDDRSAWGRLREILEDAAVDLRVRISMSG